MQNRPSEKKQCIVHHCEKTAGSGKPESLARSPAERSGGGFACSPDVSAYRLGPRIVYSLHASYRVECETSGLGDHHVERRQHDVDLSAELVDPMKAALSARPVAGDMIAVVRKMLTRSEAWSLADDLVTFDYQTAAVRLQYHPFAPEQRDGTVRFVFDRDEVDECMWGSVWQALAAMMVDQPVEVCREARDFNRSLRHARRFVNCTRSRDTERSRTSGPL